MMDMKAPLNVSNTQAKKVEVPQKVNTPGDDVSSDFDQHLSQQIAQSDSAKASVKPDKRQDNQIVIDESVAHEVVAPEQVIDPSLSEYLALNLSLVSETTENVDVPSDAPIELSEVLQIPQQIIPQSGKVLPQAVNMAQLAGKQSQAQNVASSQLNNFVTTDKVSDLPKQAALADVLKEDTTDKSLSVEFKAEVKKPLVGNQSAAGMKAGLSMANLIAAASNQQFVPQSMQAAAVNMPPVSVTDGFTASTPISSSISTAVQSPNWSQGLTERVSWMLQGNIQSAELKLNPANLGPIRNQTVHSGR